MQPSLSALRAQSVHVPHGSCADHTFHYSRRAIRPHPTAQGVCPNAALRRSGIPAATPDRLVHPFFIRVRPACGGTAVPAMSLKHRYSDTRAMRSMRDRRTARHAPFNSDPCTRRNLQRVLHARIRHPVSVMHRGEFIRISDPEFASRLTYAGGCRAGS